MDDGTLAAAVLKARGTKVVELPDGTRVKIARLSPARLMAATGGLLDLASLSKENLTRDGDPANVGRSERALVAIERIVQAGVTEPLLALERTAEGPPVAADFSLDEQFIIFGAILELSGYTKEAGAAIRP